MCRKNSMVAASNIFDYICALTSINQSITVSVENEFRRRSSHDSWRFLLEEKLHDARTVPSHCFTSLNNLSGRFSRSSCWRNRVGVDVAPHSKKKSLLSFFTFFRRSPHEDMKMNRGFTHCPRFNTSDECLKLREEEKKQSEPNSNDTVS